MKKAHRSEFIAEVKQRYPELREGINKEQGLLTFEAAVFRKFIQRKIDATDKDTVIEAYKILDHYFSNGNKSLNHTIRDMVCEDLELSKTENTDRRWAFSALPSALKKERIQWFEFMGYNKE